MRTIQMTLEPQLVDRIDREARRLGLSRSAFARRAFAAALEQARTAQREKRHAEGYRRKPIRKGEFDVWADEQVWID